ncbi:flagellin FliC, partial [Escherichia coli]
ISKFKATGTDNYDVGGDAYTVNVDSGAVKDTTGNDIFVSAADGSLTTKSDTNIAGTGIDATALAAAAKNKAQNDKFTFNGVEFTTTTAADGNGNGVYSAEIDGKSVTFTVTDADKKASLITSET